MDVRKLGLGLGAFAVGAAAWAWGAGHRGDRIKRRLGGGAAGEHVPTDLLGDAPPRAGDRAPAAFRPDPTAIPTADEREALRPATGPAPTLAADRGSGMSDSAGVA